MKVIALCLLFVGLACSELVLRRPNPNVITTKGDGNPVLVDWMSSTGVLCFNGNSGKLKALACPGGSVGSTDSVPEGMEFAMDLNCAGGEDNMGKCKKEQRKPSDCGKIVKCEKKRDAELEEELWGIA